MSTLYIERIIARQIAYTMPRFSDHSRSMYVKFNFRCPICGDGSTSHKTRGWFYESKGKVRFGCFNCGRNMPLTSYLYQYDQERWKEYLFEKYKDNPRAKPTVSEPEPEPETDAVTSIAELPFCERIDLLPPEHPMRKWMANRCIPEHRLELFFFTSEWRKLSNQLKPGTYERDDPEYRLVIPLYNVDGSISIIQGRALSDVDHSQRYLTVKIDDDAKKIYGMERVDGSKTVWFHEGPIDSVFIPNSLAIVGGSMALTDTPFKDTRVWVLDNEPRKKDTVKRIKNLIDAGERVVLWDRIQYRSKDINDMIKNEKATAEEIEQYLKNNIVHGLTATHRFMNWSKI